MTKEQNDILNRIKATYAAKDYDGSTMGYYLTTDIGALLNVLEEQQDKLSCVRDDLYDLSVDLKTGREGDILHFVDSTIAFIDSE